MNLPKDNDYDYFINIDTTNYIERYDACNNAVYCKQDCYIQPYTIVDNNHNLALVTPYKNIDNYTMLIIMHVIGGCVICVATIIFISEVYQ